MLATYEEAKKAAASIRKAVDPYSVVLFGSVAREGAGNDLDLLVLFDDEEKNIENIGTLVQKSLSRYYKKFSIDPFIISLSKWHEYQKKGSPFIRLIAKEGKVLFMKNRKEEWAEQAREEFEMSRYLLDGGYFKGACYHAQQSLGKAMKARLLEKGWDLEKTHNAARLVAIGKELRVRFPLSEEDILFVDSIYRGRYPVESGLLPLGAPNKEEAEKAIKLAERLVRLVKKITHKGKK